MKAIIIDDEIRAIDSLKWEIGNFTPQVEIVNDFNNPFKAKKFLKENKIDLVFLDVEMPIMNGIDFLRSYGKKTFEVIFTTAHSKFAYDALKNDAIDYLLKPVESIDLVNAVEKTKQRIEEKKLINKLRSNVGITGDRQKVKIDKLRVYLDGEVHFLDFDQVICLKSEGNYCHIILENGEKKLITQSLKGILKNLPSGQFFRTHKSYVVNVDKIEAYNKKDNIITLNDCHIVPLARNRKKEFSELYL